MMSSLFASNTSNAPPDSIDSEKKLSNSVFVCRLRAGCCSHIKGSAATAKSVSLSSKQRGLSLTSGLINVGWASNVKVNLFYMNDLSVILSRITSSISRLTRRIATCKVRLHALVSTFHWIALSISKANFFSFIKTSISSLSECASGLG